MSDLLKLSPEAQDLLFREARTANSFTDEPVSDEQVEAIQDLVKYGPTAMNCQPLRVILVRSDDARARLLKHMSDGNRVKTATAPLVAILAADTNFNENLPQVFPHAEGAKDWFPDPEAREAMARLNAGLQIGYFLMGVRAAGLAAGPMTGFDAAGIDEDLLAGTGFKAMVVVNIGHPGENAWFDRLPRLEHEQVVTTL
ncbi:malonic semialdehyde reductase [Aeromicrobium duanguangcaii]|uniref:Malonic semialdehyde reductase n=1 Tax=Aeromicrobium duanguangcaii TaxID=2968086 RepID=A0ABY5KK57_9ACTN|nr:malonic semialdehyde reductase [Aeromicrobium duanguangcaii]MCD9153527.1 malonic semialdehyde reductase [Aeromicrobium duanguangcaii]UUI69385.1 malonic semialdehyde reductase [Aeromicrobium duanguangcaii]